LLKQDKIDEIIAVLKFHGELFTDKTLDRVANILSNSLNSKGEY